MTITADTVTHSENQTILTVQKKELDTNNKETVTKMMYLDSDGNLIINGSIKINSPSGIDSLTSWVDNSINTATTEVSNNLSDTINENYNALAIAMDKQSQSTSENLNNSINSLRSELQDDAQNKYDTLWNNIVENQDNLYTTIDEQYKTITKENDDKLNAYKAEVGQFLEFNSSGLTIGATSSQFKTMIDNQGMFFMAGDIKVAYISNNQLYIPHAIIENTLSLGKFFFSPHSNRDGGVSLTWQGD